MLKTWRAVAFTLLAALLAALPGGPLHGETPEERGDRAFARRADGFAESGVPNATVAATAVAAYEEALAAEPENLQLRLKLMDAIYFQGYFVIGEKERQREIYERLVELATRALDLAAAPAGGREELADRSPKERAELLREVPEGAAVYYWLTASWGLWGMTHNPFSAVRKGVASKVRDYAQMITLLDEGYENAAGLRMLGRLHTDAPRVPFITGWVDRQEGLELLRRAVEVSRRDPRNLLFLAEGILEYDEERRGEALELLRELAAREPDADEVVEQSESLEQARRLLEELEE